MQDSSRKRINNARQRQQERQKRREAMATLRQESAPKLPNLSQVPLPKLKGRTMPTASLGVGLGWLRDALWRVMNRTMLPRLVGGFVVVVTGLFILSTFFSGNIAPNVWGMGVDLGAKSPEEAQTALLDAFRDQTITIRLDAETIAQVSPADIGLSLDADAMITKAQAVGLTSIPFGVFLEPVVNLNLGTMQTYLLELADDIYEPSYEAGYVWENDQVVGVMGRASRELDINVTMERAATNPMQVATQRQLTLLTKSTPPDVLDPSPYLEQARRFIARQLRLQGYDPFTDETIAWATTPDEMAQWLAAGANGLILRPRATDRLVDAINATLNVGDLPRYLDKREVAQQIDEAIRLSDEVVTLRVRYLPRPYEVVRGDSGFRIGFKTGLPFKLLEEANPNLEWNFLTVGQRINLPSRDVMLPYEPIPHKRIVVDLERLWLVAFENGEIVFSWPISSGRGNAPTYPGVFQILSHVDVAFGSSFALCGSNGECGQWEMNWFMGIYEVAPELMNGFHGAVLLPDGSYLGGGGVRGRTTFGCVMSEDTQARQLYEWAEIGTMVEILSPDFRPESAIGRRALEHISQVAYN